VSEVAADVVVVGGGAAGAAAALTAAAGGRRVVMLVKGELGDGATAWAQGGLAAVVDPGDSVADHVQDTLVAGAGLCDVEAVTRLARQAPGVIARLAELGARFDRAGGRLSLGREGGHRHHRIVHAGGDASGREVTRTLSHALQRSTVQVREHVTVTDVLLDEAGQAAGVDLLDATGAGERLSARAVVLATGGLGQAYAATSNPPAATGDGIVLALRAGATALDMEFVQFHPTVLWTPYGSAGQQPLVTEALRGAGAVLLDTEGRRVMEDLHPLRDLAPRDVVSAALHARMGETGADHAYLDATPVPAVTLERGFPTVLAACRRAGVDPLREPIPVVPAAHYHCGGVDADLDGRTGVPGLRAVGEVARTGVHGANRLASNSLTEALLSGYRAGRALAHDLPELRGPIHPAPPPLGSVDAGGRPATARAMSARAGVVRDADGLDDLLARLSAVSRLPQPGATRADVEASNLHLVSLLVATAARTRDESRGSHRRSDAPDTDPRWETAVSLTLRDGALHTTVRTREVAA